MKNILIIIAAVAACSLLSSCKSPLPSFDVDAETLSRNANTALVAAQIGGVINPEQAKTARSAGKLVLDLTNPDAPKDQSQGKLTEVEAAELRRAGEVPLSLPAASPLLPPIPATK